MPEQVSYVDDILDALQSHGLRPDRKANTYNCNSPFRPGSDSMAFRLTVDPQYGGGGKWYDFVADEGGNFVTLARRLGIIADPTPAGAAPAAPTSKRAYVDLADYARSHGVEATVFLAAHWRQGEWYCPVAGRRRPALLFETATGTRARFIDGLPKPHPTYLNQKGFTRCWYGLKGALRLDGPLVYTNGEASTVVAQALGVPAITVAGGGEKRLPEDLLDELVALVPPGSREILIALDSDTAGQRAARQLVAQLRAADYSARAVDLQGHTGFDLADFCRLHGADTLTDLQALPELPEEAPADLAGPQAEIVRTQQTLIQSLQKALGEVQERLRWLTDLMARKDLKVGTRAAMRGLLLEMERVPVDEQTPDRWYEVRVSKIATENGTTPGTISKALSRLESLGMIEKQTTTSHDPETGVTRSTVYARLHVDITDLAKVPPIPKAQATPRPRCTTCGTHKLRSFVYECEHLHYTMADELKPEADAEACFPMENTLLDDPPPEQPEQVDQPCFPMENTPSMQEVGSAVPDLVFFAERDCVAPGKSYENSTDPLTEDRVPALPTETTPAQEAPPYGPGFVDGLIERLRRRTGGAAPQPT